MSQKTRTIQWIEGKIIEILSKRCQITTYLALSSCVLQNVRSIEEQHNLDIAVQNLISRKLILVQKDQDGFTTYQAA